MAKPGHPNSGREFPWTLRELRSTYPDEASCLGYLERLRWPRGRRCAKCHSPGDFVRLKDGRWRCPDCGYRFSPLAGTIFYRSRTPLPSWFEACWRFATTRLPGGVSASSLQSALGIDSYERAWAMLHQLRSLLAHPATTTGRLSGTVELGVRQLGPPAARQPCLVAVAVVRGTKQQLGWSRFLVLTQHSSDALGLFVAEHVRQNATLVGDDLTFGLLGPSERNRFANAIEPSCGRLIFGADHLCRSAEQWLVRVHRGAIERRHLQCYLDEFAFRLGHRDSVADGFIFRRLLELGVSGHPASSLQAEPKAAGPGLSGCPGDDVASDVKDEGARLTLLERGRLPHFAPASTNAEHFWLLVAALEKAETAMQSKSSPSVPSPGHVLPMANRLALVLDHELSGESRAAAAGRLPVSARSLLWYRYDLKNLLGGAGLLVRGEASPLRSITDILEFLGLEKRSKPQRRRPSPGCRPQDKAWRRTMQRRRTVGTARLSKQRQLERLHRFTAQVRRDERWSRYLLKATVVPGVEAAQEAGATLGEIANALGITVGTLLYHLPELRR